METLVLQCLERHLCDYDLQGLELCIEDAEAVIEEMKRSQITMLNAVDVVLKRIYDCLNEN